ncbi:hypothetical protein [Prevotella sp.]|uniref:hypothetical protein n=1 Tax=Prevotella sp. TaxID=59823 RepID=UPI0027E34353|nr:hypothetical protein [Prevotella sp.]
MKKLKFFIGLVLVLFASLFFASCNDDVEETMEQEWAHVLDNHGVAYSFSDNGNCFGDGGGIGQADFNNMFIGHGWKHYATWEIDKNGKRKSAEYYSNMLGLAPENYYFDSDTKLTTYCRSIALGGAVKKNEVTYTFNGRYNGTPRTVLLLDNNEYIQITGWTLGAQPTFCMVHPLGIEADGTTVYGVSLYVQMTDKELKAMQDSAK